MRLENWILIIAATLGSPSAFADRSPVIEGMNLTLVGPALNVSVHAAKVFLSMDGNSMSAANATLELRLTKSAAPRLQHFTCHSFRFDLRSDFLVCDSHEVAHGKTILMNGLSGSVSLF